MTVDPKHCPFPLTRELVEILNQEIEKVHPLPKRGLTLNFRDPSYSAETGGFHPVEIRIDSKGRVLYITDFAFVRSGPFAELAKEIDFDFSLGLFQHMGREFPLAHGRPLFALWQRNFVQYYRMGVYQVTAETA